MQSSYVEHPKQAQRSVVATRWVQVNAAAIMTSGKPMRPSLRNALILGGIAVFAVAASASASASQQLPRGVLLEARAALAEGRVDDALIELESLVERFPDSAWVALWYGHAWRAKGDRPAASVEYLRGLELQPDNPQLLIAIGDLHGDAGDLARATDYYRRAIAAAPEFPLAHRKAATAEIERMRHGAAIGHLKSYVELVGDDIEALNVLGIEQYMNEDHQGAIETLEKVLRIDPDNAKAHFGLGMALSDRSSEYDRSLSHLRRAIELEPTNPTAHYMAGRVLTAQEQLDEALQALQRSLELSPDLADAHYRIALVYTRLGDRDAARNHQQRFQELTRAQDDLEAEATRIGLLRNAATAALASNELQEFRDAIGALLLAEPDNPGVLTLSARGALVAGDFDRGLADVTRALEITPERPEPLYVHGMLLYRAGRHQEARLSLERALQANPLSAFVHGALGNALVALGETREAVDEYRAAIRLDPDQAAHYLNLATAYQTLGETELEAEAMATYRRLLRQHP